MIQARPLTLTQQMTLDAIKLYLRTHDGISPTLRELAASMSKSLATVYEHALSLRAKGWITMDANGSRSIRILGRCSQCGRLVEADPKAAAVEEVELQRLADDGGRA